jgi:hypothetical protein
VSVESALLDALKSVVDPELRKRIEDALVTRQREIYLKKKEAEKG